MSYGLLHASDLILKLIQHYTYIHIEYIMHGRVCCMLSGNIRFVGGNMKNIEHERICYMRSFMEGTDYMSRFAACLKR